MKAFGIVLVAVGLASLAAGGVFLAGLLRRVADARVVRTIPFEGHLLSPSGILNVSTERLCQVKIVFHPDLKAFGDVDLGKIRNEYGPDSQVRVLDDAGQVLLQEKFDGDGLAGFSNGWTGSVELSSNSGKFEPPASGRIRVESAWSPRVGAQHLKSAELQVYDRVSDHTQAGVYTALFGVSGGAALLLGASLLLARLVGGKGMPTTSA